MIGNSRASDGCWSAIGAARPRAGDGRRWLCPWSRVCRSLISFSILRLSFVTFGGLLRGRLWLGIA